MTKLTRNEKGFTLIELLVVIIIIGILAAIGVPQYLKQADKAWIGRAKAEMKTIQNSLSAYAAENGGKYPKAVNGANSDEIKTVLTNDGIKWTGAAGGMVDPWGKPYWYSVDNDTNLTAYKICSSGPDKKFAAGADDNLTASGDSSGSTEPASGVTVANAAKLAGSDISSDGTAARP